MVLRLVLLSQADGGRGKAGVELVTEVRLLRELGAAGCAERLGTSRSTNRRLEVQGACATNVESGLEA